jgi:hypothetical protein
VAGIDTPAGYTSLQRLGTGAEAVVHRAWDERAGTWVVLRLYHRFAQGRAEEAAFATFCATAVSLGRHPAIVPVRAGGITATGRPWLALEEIEGRTLEQVLQDDPPSPAAAIQLAVTLADALAWAYATRPPMTHGRLRAEHVLITTDGKPMLHDFAVPSGSMTDGRLTNSGLTNSGLTDGGLTDNTLADNAQSRDDITALAALLYRAFTGAHWPGDGDDRLIHAWPGLTGLLDETLTPVPAIETMTDFADRLRLVAAAGTLPPAPVQPVASLPAFIETPLVRPKHRLPAALLRWLRRRSPELPEVTDSGRAAHPAASSDELVR